MIYNYRELGSAAILNYYKEEKNLSNPILKDLSSKTLGIAWNKSGPQDIILDGSTCQLPGSSLIPLFGFNNFRFSNPEHIVLWEFNREFYCIIDHDKEVSCAGFLFYGYHRPMLIKLSEKDNKRLEVLQHSFEDEFSETDTIHGEMLRMLIKRLIILATRKGKEQYLDVSDKDNDEYDIVRQFSLLVEENYRKLHQVQDYAQLLNRSPKTLSNIFNKIKADSPIQIIMERVCLEAKRLLLYSDYNISEIADQLGFENSSGFSKYFKKIVGQSPSKFRMNAMLSS